MYTSHSVTLNIIRQIHQVPYNQIMAINKACFVRQRRSANFSHIRTKTKKPCHSFPLSATNEAGIRCIKNVIIRTNKYVIAGTCIIDTH